MASDTGSRITAEEEELMAKAMDAIWSGKADEFWKEGTVSFESFASIAHKVARHHEKTFALWESVHYSGRVSQLELHGSHSPQEREALLRKVAEDMAVSVRVGLGKLFEPLLTDVWSSIAGAIIAQKGPKVVEAQRILLQLVTASLAKAGPHSKVFLCHWNNLAVAFGAQEKHELAARMLEMGLILAKYGHKENKDVQLLCDYSQQLGMCRKTIGDHGPAEFYLREAAEMAERVGDMESASAALNSCGDLLKEQRKYAQAEAVFKKALDVKLKQTGIKVVTQSLEELKDLSTKALEEMLKEHGITIPAGSERADLALLLWEKAVKAPICPIKDEMTFLQLGKYGEHLFFQSDIFPEKLPSAEAIFRQVLAAKRVHPEYGQDDGGYLKTTDELANTLCYQHKYIEGLDVRKKALAIRKRVIGVHHPTYVNSNGKIKDVLRQQSKAFADAEKILGPRSSWPADTDGYPASVMFQATVQEARNKRALSRTSSTSASSRSYTPTAYDPDDVKDVNLSALWAGLGAGEFKEDADQMGGRFFINSGFLKETADPQAKEMYANALNLVKTSMELRGELPGIGEDIPAVTQSIDELKELSVKSLKHMLQQRGIPIPRGAEKKDIAALLISHPGKASLGAAPLKLQLLSALESSNGLLPDGRIKEAIEQEVARLAEMEQQKGNSSSTGSPSEALRTKPMHVCIGCGKKAPNMLKCSRCNKARACSSVCFDAAWHGGHKLTCERRVKEKGGAGVMR